MEELELDAWYEVHRIADNAYRIRERLDILEPAFGVKWVNMYLLVGSDKAALVDSGMGLKPVKPVVRELTDLPVIVLNTHGHWDHIGGNSEFDIRLAHRAEVERMAENTPLPFINEVLEARPDLAKRLGREATDDFTVSGSAPTRFAKEGDLIDLGDRRLGVLEVPGHSPRHLAFVARDGGLLVTGDAVYEGNMWGQIEDGDPRELVESVKKLATMDNIEEFTVLPGHELPFPGSRLAEIADFLARALRGEPSWTPWLQEEGVRRYEGPGELAVYMRAPEDIEG